LNDKRPPKEVSQSKELAETKRENHKLKRQMAKLQKRLVKVLESGGVPAEESPGETLVVDNLSPSGDQCPECSETLTVMSFGPKTLRVCKKCKWRKVD